MIKKLLFALCIGFGSTFFLQAQGYTFFSAPNDESFQQNALMPSDSGVYFCMKKNATQTSLYWLKNNVLTEVKNIGTQYDVVMSKNGTYGKQWFTNKNKALFVVYSQYTGGGKVCITDGTALGTDTLFSYGYGSNVTIAGMIGTDLYLSKTSLTPYQTVLYKTNFTKSGTSIVKTITQTNLSSNYIDNQKLYLSGYLKIGTNSFAVLYGFASDTTRLLLGQNFFPARVMNGHLYAYANGSSFSRKNLATNVVSTVSIPDTKEGDRINHIDQILGIQKDVMYLKCNLAGPNNIANCRIYSGNVAGIQNVLSFAEIRSNAGTSIPLSNANFQFLAADTSAYFFGINGYAGAVSIFSTDGTVAGTKLVQELMTGSAWVWAAASSIYTLGNRVYYAGSDYKIGSTLHSGWAFSGGNASTSGLSLIDLNAGANATIQDLEKFQNAFIYTIGSATSNKVYALNANSTATLLIQKTAEQTALQIYPNPSNGLFTIELNESSRNSDVSIYNLMGENVFNQNLSDTKTVVNSNLKSGIYFVKTVDVNGRKQTNKVIID